MESIIVSRKEANQKVTYILDSVIGSRIQNMKLSLEAKNRKDIFHFDSPAMYRRPEIWESFCEFNKIVLTTPKRVVSIQII